MYGGRNPRWLTKLEKYLGWIAVPNIAILLVTLQAAGFLMVSSNPAWVERLALLPMNVLQGGELWRLVTFLALPLSTSPLWVIVALMFIYSILNSIEAEWGSFRTTLYVLVSVLLTIAVSLTLEYPVLQVSDFESTLFLAAATLFPEMEVRIFFLIPAKMKHLAWISVAFLLYKLFESDWAGRILLLAVYSNYLVFFGPALLDRVRQSARRKNFQRKMRD